MATTPDLETAMEGLAGAEAREAPDAVANRPPPGLLQRFMESAALLVRSQDEIFSRVHTQERWERAKAAAGARGKLAAWLDGLPGLAEVPGLADWLYYSLAEALALHAGFGRKAGVAVPAVYASFFEDELLGGAVLPEAVAAQLDAVLPGMAASALQEYERGGGREGFLERLSGRARVFFDNASVYAARVRGEDGYLRLLDPESAANLNPGMLEAMMARVAEGDMGAPEGVEHYLLSRELGASLRTFGLEPGGLGAGFADYPELESMEQLEQGLETPRKLTLSETAGYFNPAMFFRRPFEVAGRRLSPVALFYGFDGRISEIFQKLLLGDAALVDFNPAVLSDLFAGALAEGRAFDDVSRELRARVVAPGAGGRPDALGYSLLGARTGGADFLTGPAAVEAVLRALGAEDPLLAVRMQEHFRKFPRLQGGRGATGDAVYVAQERKLLLDGFGFGRVPLMSKLRSTVVPLVRVPPPVPDAFGEAVYDETRRLMGGLAAAARQLEADGASMEYRARLQVLMGYYVLGPGAYDALRLPYQRLERAPSRGFLGLLPSLEGKTGWYRTVYEGYRLPWSARLIAAADTGLPADTIGLPPLDMAVLRGHLLSQHLHAAFAQSPEPAVRAKASFFAAVFDACSRDCPDANLFGELRSRVPRVLRRLAGEEAGMPGAVAAVTGWVSDRLPPGERRNFDYICGRGSPASNGYGARRFLRHLAHVCLTDPMVSDYLTGLNRDWRMVISRYPRLHAQSFLAVRTRLNAPDDEAVRVHPLVATPLNLDFDGDMMEVQAVKELNPRFLPLLDEQAADRVIFDAGTVSGLAFGLDLNALEGLIKGNMHFHAPGTPKDGAVWGGDLEELAAAELPVREELIRRCENDSNALAAEHARLLGKFAGILGGADDPTATGAFLAVDEGGRTTRVSRLAMHLVMERLLGRDTVAAAFGDRYLADGVRSRTEARNLYSGLLARAVEAGEAEGVGEAGGADGLALEASRPPVLGLLAGCYNLGSSLAVLESGSGRETGLTLHEQLMYVHDDPLVARLRTVFRERVVALECAHARGFLSGESVTSALVRLERGAGGGSEWEARFEALRSAYLSSGAEGRAEAHARAQAFLMECAERLDIGTRPLLKAAARLVTDRYEIEHGAPHVWSEQLLSGKIKAREDVLGRASVGAVQVVDGVALPTLLDDLLEGFTPDGLAVSGGYALSNSVDSKTEVPIAGEFLKDLQAVLRRVKVGQARGREGREGAVRYLVSDYARRDGFVDLRLLAERCKCRSVKLVFGPGGPGREEAEALGQEFGVRLRRVPFDASSAAAFLGRWHARYPGLSLEVASPLYGGGFPQAVSPRAIGVHPMLGCVAERTPAGVAAVRQPLEELPHVQLPVGALAAGAMGEDGSQASMRIRHTGALSRENYSSLADYWRMKYGPFPSRSPFFRKGAERLVMDNPFAHDRLRAKDVAFQAAVRAPDTPGWLRVESGVVEVDGIQLYPGEVYSVRDGRLVAGTDRPGRMHYCLRPDASRFEGVERVSATRLVMELPVAQAEKLADGLPVLGLRDVRVDGHPVSVLNFDGACRMIFDAGAYAAVLGKLGLRPGAPDLPPVIPAEGSRYLPVADSALPGGAPEFFRVAEPSVFAKQNGEFVPGGAVFSPGASLVAVSSLPQLREVAKGFMVMLDYLKSRPLSPYPAVLAPCAGEVRVIQAIKTWGDVAVFEVGFQPAKGGPLQVISLKLPAGHFPSAREGQALEPGDPLSFGHVRLEERASLRPEFRRELADYLFANFNQEGPGIWSAHVELLARALVSPGKDGDRFLSLGRAYRTPAGPDAPGDLRLFDVEQAASRLGNMDHVMLGGLLNLGAVRGGDDPVFSPEELQHSPRERGQHPVGVASRLYKNQTPAREAAGEVIAAGLGL
ncbi:hypothetical protein OH491_24775 [Termitidicoccus mucosus]|uniref:RNA polymerase alpha subunit domain-containing protein n=1 Tax=Termitidicoccus mucosus TaxID=1184151 RepID=A0A178IQF2_9BACT|nr:hypothetical protein AW736_01750 [Opitutaceae bacterium TSB47]